MTKEAVSSLNYTPDQILETYRLAWETGRWSLSYSQISEITRVKKQDVCSIKYGIGWNNITGHPKYKEL